MFLKLLLQLLCMYQCLNKPLFNKRFRKCTVADLPECTLTSIIIYNSVFNMNFMGIRLSDHDQCAFIFRWRSLLYPVIASDVSWISSREIGWLDSAKFTVALIEYPVAVTSCNHLTSPSLKSAISVPEVCIALFQIFVWQFEIKIVTNTL